MGDIKTAKYMFSNANWANFHQVPRSCTTTYKNGDFVLVAATSRHSHHNSRTDKLRKLSEIVWFPLLTKRCAKRSHCIPTATTLAASVCVLLPCRSLLLLQQLYALIVFSFYTAMNPP